MKNKAFYSKIGKIGIKLRWQRFHSSIKFPNHMTKEKASLHAYLCGDGNISIRKERKAKRVHYEISFFPDDPFMLKNFQNAFLSYYGIMPLNIRKEGKMFRLRIANKVICQDLLRLGKYGKYDWTIPKEILKKFKETWLACFFDCEAHVNKKGVIQVKSVNQKGLENVKTLLESLNINPRLNGPYTPKMGSPYCVLTIAKKEEILRYRDKIGFNHSEKVKKLNSVLSICPDETMVLCQPGKISRINNKDA